jgi:GNAT superfamily N-acetyltransferase
MYPALPVPCALVLARGPKVNPPPLDAGPPVCTISAMADPLTFHDADPDAPPAQACLAAYFALLAQVIPGFAQPALPLPDAADFRPPLGAFRLAMAGRRPLGCVSLRAHAPGTAEVKRLWVAPQARGRGLARRLMQDIETRALALGYSRLILDTNAGLPAAIALYESSGWAAIPAYSGFPATHWFGKTL